MLRKIKRYFFLFLYYSLFRKWRKELGGDVLRSLTCKHIFQHYGNKAMVKRNVAFGKGMRISIGHNSYIGEDSYLNVHADIHIGTNVMIGPQIMILTGNHCFANNDLPICKQPSIGLAVIIKDNVWIGARSIILPGITVGEGAVVGAGSVVTKDIPDFSVVGGNPAIILKNRLKPMKEAFECKSASL
jgi:maltose O-acetyltransferase